MDSVKQRSNEPAHVETNAQKQNLTTTLPAANKNKTAATATTATAANQNKTAATTTATNLKQANQNTERRFSYEIDPDIGVIV